jgi:hypothetical protein
MLLVSPLPVHGAGAALPPASVSYLTAAASTADATSYTFSVSFGSTDPDRTIVVCHTGRFAVPSSPTIGGISATIGASHSPGNVTTSIFAAKVPSGTSGNVVIPVGYDYRATIAVYRVIGLVSLTPTDVDTNGTSSFSATGEEGGVAFLSSGVVSFSSAGVMSLTGVTENFENAPEGGQTRFAAGSALIGSNGAFNASVSSSGADVRSSCLVCYR